MSASRPHPRAPPPSWPTCSPPARSAPSRSTRRTSTGSPPSTSGVHAFLHVARDQAPGRRRAVDGARAAGQSGTRWPASRSRSRTSSPPRACRPPAGRGSWRAGCRRTTRPWSAGCARPAGRSSARPTWTSSRWAPPPSTPRYGPTRNPWDLDRIPGGSRRRLGGGGRRVRGAAGDRHRHRRLDPAAGGRHRHGRGQADLRRGVALRPDRAGQQPRPGRPVRPHRARRRAAARGDRRARPARLHQHRRAGARRSSQAARAGCRRRRWPASGSASSASSAARATRPASGPGSTRPSQLLTEAGAEVVEVSCPSFTARARRVLPDPAERGEQQPGQVRRDALRPAGLPRRRRRPDAPSR